MGVKGLRGVAGILFAVFYVLTIGGADARAAKKLSDKPSFVAVGEILGR